MVQPILRPQAIVVAGGPQPFRRPAPVPGNQNIPGPTSRRARRTATGPVKRPSGENASAVRVGRRQLTITNPDKVFFPERGLTKGDLVAYYLDVAPCALHHIRRRPFHMKRYPNGVVGDFFHQKRVPAHPDYVDEQFVRFPSGHSTVFAVIDNAPALAWVINLGCIELHTWHSRVEDI